MADQDPTQTGGQEKELSTEERIAARITAEQAPDFSQFDEDTGEVLPKEDAPSPEPDKEPVEVEADKEPEPVAPKMASIVVDGQTIEVEESRILEAGKRTLQKDQAADRRLQEAAKLKRDAEEYAARVGYKGPSQDAQPQPALSQDVPTPTTFSPEMLDTVLENKLYNRDAQKAAAKFKADFPEIAEDPHLMNMAATLENQRLSTVTALGESYGDPFEAYHKHGEAIRAWLGKYKPVAEPTADKVERKRTITAIPAVNARAPAPQPEKPLTVSELIEEERRSRGGRPLKR